MRILLFVLWMLIPVGALAFHLGPGQSRMDLDRASQVLLQADQFAAQKKWDLAQAQYEQALTLVPGEQVERVRRIRLERAKAQMENAQLPAAHADLKSLVTELSNDKEADSGLLEEAQSTLASSQFYMTWLMRLEGLSPEQWQPEIDAAQQTYRLLARNCADENSEQFTHYTEDLESAVRLARMDLGELQGLPLPSQ